MVSQLCAQHRANLAAVSGSDSGMDQLLTTGSCEHVGFGVTCHLPKKAIEEIA